MFNRISSHIKLRLSDALSELISQRIKLFFMLVFGLAVKGVLAQPTSLYLKALQAYNNHQYELACVLTDNMVTLNGGSRVQEEWLLRGLVYIELCEMTPSYDLGEVFTDQAVYSLSKTIALDNASLLADSARIKLVRIESRLTEANMGASISDSGNALLLEVENLLKDGNYDAVKNRVAQSAERELIYNSRLAFDLALAKFRILVTSIESRSFLKQEYRTNPSEKFEMIAELLERVEEDNPWYTRAIEMRDSLEILKKLREKAFKVQEDSIYAFIISENYTDPLEHIEKIIALRPIIKRSFRRDKDFVYPYLGKLFYRLCNHVESSIEAKRWADLAELSFKHAADNADQCDFCSERLSQLSSKRRAIMAQETSGKDLSNALIALYMAGDLISAQEYADSVLALEEAIADSRIWYYRGQALRDLYIEYYDYLDLPSEALRYQAVSSFDNAFILDTAMAVVSTSGEAIKFLASELYEDLPGAIYNHQFDRAKNYYRLYKLSMLLVDPSLNFEKSDLSYAMELLKEKRKVLDTIQPYDTLFAKQIDSHYVALLKKFPNHKPAATALRLHRANDAERKRGFYRDLVRESALNKAESERRRTQIWAMSACLFVSLLAAIGAIRAYRNKRKKNLIITEQKKNIEHAKSALEHKNKEILDSITYAKRIQKAILPPSKLIEKYLPQSFVFYKPKDIVAGDFYWLEPKGRQVLFAAADCTGHGVPGAMVSVICNNGLNRSVREFGLDRPGEILDNTRTLVTNEFEKSEEGVPDGMDISLCSLNTSTGELLWAGANNPIWIIRNGAQHIEEIKPDKQPVGSYDYQKPFHTHQLKLEEGDQIYVFSDGFQDQFGGPLGKKYKSKRFKQLLLEVSQFDVISQRNKLEQRFDEWKGNNEQVDDICIIGVRF